MLKIKIQATELYDESTNGFINIKEQVLNLEHSLVSLSKWESIRCKPFLTKQEKTVEETIEYIKCMTISQNIDDNVYKCITNEHIAEVRKYIEADMTATKIKTGNNTNREIITSEIIYYWMISLNIPLECQKWHLNRLLTLVNVCNLKNSPPKKMGKQELLSRNAELNAARKKQLNTKG